MRTAVLNFILAQRNRNRFQNLYFWETVNIFEEEKPNKPNYYLSESKVNFLIYKAEKFLTSNKSVS